MKYLRRCLKNQKRVAPANDLNSGKNKNTKIYLSAFEIVFLECCLFIVIFPAGLGFSIAGYEKQHKTTYANSNWQRQRNGTDSGAKIGIGLAGT
jgi:hypothetical protein